jgi:hypothetical protein
MGDIEVGAGGGSQLVLEGRTGHHRCSDMCSDLLGVALEQGDHQSIPITEVVVDHGPRHSTGPGQSIHPQGIGTTIGQQLLGGVEQEFPPLCGWRAGRSSPTGVLGAARSLHRLLHRLLHAGHCNYIT